MGKITALDTAWDGTGRWMSVLKPALQYVDYFIPSIEEAIELAGGETDHKKIADCFFDCGVSHVAIKVGKDGCYYRESREAEGKYVAPFMRENPVDTTGAGDFYAAGFLYGLTQGLDLRQCGTIGAVTAGKVIEIVGTTLSDEAWDDIFSYVNRVKTERYLF
jgi:sugar/nucleoside kinase (ribokinase family)